MAFADDLFFGLSAVKDFGWYDGNSGGVILASLACWCAFVAAIAYFASVWKGNSIWLIRSVSIAVPLIAGVIGDLAMYWLISDNPKLWFPPTFFIWPAIAFVGVGMLLRMLPNSSLQAGPAASGRPLS
jgi:hypothetical protein